MVGDVWTPYCGPAPTPLSWLGRWNLDPFLLAAIGAVFLWLWWVRPDRAGRTAAIAALALTVVIFISPLCALSAALFSARTVHHLLLILGVAPLLAFVLPVAKRPSLVAAVAVQAVVLWAWHAPATYEAALSNDVVYWIMQLTLLGSAVWFWRALGSANAPAAVVGLLASMLSMGLLGAVLTFAGEPVYAPHFATTVAWGLTPLEDQQTAGLTMWAPASAIYLLAALWRLSRLFEPTPAARTA